MKKDKLKDTIKEIPSVEMVPIPVSKKRRYVFEVILILLITAFALLTFLAKTISYFNFDLQITKTIQSFHPVWFDFWMKFMSASVNAIYGGLIVIFMSLGLFIKKRKAEGLTLIISGVGVEVLSVVLKAIVKRPRPDPNLITQLEHFTKNDSFPSGHVLYAMGLYGFLFFLVFTKLKKGLLRNSLIFLLAGILFSMGLSRIYLGAHWFSDTLGSYLIGTIWIYLMIFIFEKISPKKL